MSKHAAGLIKKAAKAGQFIINDLDDHFWALPKGHPAVELTSPQRDKDYNRRNYRAAIRASSLVTTSTQALADAIANWGPPVTVVRNYIDARVWKPRSPGMYYGWVGSTAGRTEDLAILREAVVPWLAERGLSFYHGGVVPGEPRMSDVLKYPNVVTRPCTHVLRYPRLWDPLKVAFCPLGDTEFARCKSWVKPLEACARGIPFIASNQREYSMLGTGRLAATPEEWVRHLNALENPQVYNADLVINSKRTNSLSIENNWQTWAAILTKERECPSKKSLLSTTSP
jgi:hypothetical protein